MPPRGGSDRGAPRRRTAVTWLALSIALQQEPSQAAPSPWLSGGSIYRSARYHLGARPVATLDNEGGIHWGTGLTIQVSTPWL